MDLLLYILCLYPGWKKCHGGRGRVIWGQHAEFIPQPSPQQPHKAVLVLGVAQHIARIHLFLSAIFATVLIGIGVLWPVSPEFAACGLFCGMAVLFLFPSFLYYRLVRLEIFVSKDSIYASCIMLNSASHTVYKGSKHDSSIVCHEGVRRYRSDVEEVADLICIRLDHQDICIDCVPEGHGSIAAQKLGARLAMPHSVSESHVHWKIRR